MKVLVGCEYSGRIRNALRARGHAAWSCDLLPAEDGSPFHIQGDVFDLLGLGWDFGIFHPSCQHLSVSGARWLTDHWVHRGGCKGDGPHFRNMVSLKCRWHDGTEKRAAQAEALAFVLKLWAAPIPKMAIENPISRLSTLWRKPDQIVQPWWFGEPEFKGTCWWTRGLPNLTATNRLTPPAKGTAEHRAWSKVHMMTPGPERWKDRSRTYQGIADAVAEQWAGTA